MSEANPPDRLVRRLREDAHDEDARALQQMDFLMRAFAFTREP